MQQIIQPKEPSGGDWERGSEAPAHVTFGYPGWYWFYPKQGIAVISAVEVTNDPDDIVTGPHYHISISKKGRQRCTRNESRFVVKVFGMQDADEDNHVPGGFVRNFWQPVAEKFIGHVCPCKDEETAIIEDKGDFVWRGIRQ